MVSRWVVFFFTRPVFRSVSSGSTSFTENLAIVAEIYFAEMSSFSGFQIMLRSLFLTKEGSAPIMPVMAKSRIANFSNLSDNFLFSFSVRLVGLVNFVSREYEANRY